MAYQKDNTFFEAVLAAAAKDDREITSIVMQSITSRGLPLIFFHDENGKPVVIEREGAHGDLKKSLKKTKNGGFIAERSIGDSSYVGTAAAVFLKSLMLVTEENFQKIKREALAK